MTDRIPITPSGLRRLKDELRKLQTVERIKISKEIEVARAHGDLRENAEYHAAKEKQGHIEGRIMDINSWIARAEVIDVSKFKGTDKVIFGATVELLDTETDKKVVYRLVGRSDVFHTNFRRPTLAKLQMEYETLSRINPRLIYSRVSGFGPRGPLRDQGGFDFIVQGFSGMLKAMGDAGNELAPPLTLIIDQATSMMAASSVVAALFHRERTGRGQELHTSLLGTTVSLLYFHYLSVFLSGQEVRKHSRTSPGNLLRNYYRCADGKWIICAHNPPERYWERFCRAVGLDNLVTHPAAAEGGSRQAHPDELVAVLDRQFATKSQAEWLRIAEQHDLFFAPVNTVPEAAKERQVLENFVERVAHRDLGEVPYPGFCTEFGDAEVRPRGAAPRLGEHTDEILREAAGYTDREVEVLKADGVVGTKETGQ
jgi:formyl-CoA transferase